ncbi:flavoprotein [Saccharopolyspora sp. MS10]|uniref:flavoprotein n=1 Tax=Saccharopolyspora sp. MS10 TaxID=3385973 RepID=UPI0039A26089
MIDERRTLGLIASAAGGTEHLRTRLVEPAVARGWRVAVTLTPSAGEWLGPLGELDRIAELTGLPCRTAPRTPAEPSPHPEIDCFLLCPATANTVAKLALGLGDSQALTTAVEAVGEQRAPVVVFPTINAAHVRHPAWKWHAAALAEAGVHLLTGDHWWPLREPRTTLGDAIPWTRVLDHLDTLVPPRESTSD